MAWIDVHNLGTIWELTGKTMGIETIIGNKMCDPNFVVYVILNVSC